jgi:leucyl/phenylalanyl-tRNA--protein transferase
MERQILQQLSPDDLTFPAIESALDEPNGLLAIGGDLSSPRLIEAYTQGIFPWFNDHEPILWWSPDPRTVIFTDQIHISRSLKKFIRRCDYTVTLNQAFSDVIYLCAHAPFRQEGTWISPDMLSAYIDLHHLGYAHSVEVWYNDELVGGLYGVAINGYFSGESMFYKKENASKIALIALSQLLYSYNIPFIDCQLMNPFLHQMGATEIERAFFKQIKDSTIARGLLANLWQPKSLVITL